MKKIVILSTKPPYGSSINAEAFRAGLGLAFSEMKVDLILIGDGVYSGIKKQSPEQLQMKPLSEVYKNITEYRINLFIDKDSIEERNLKTDELVSAPLITRAQLKEKINTADVILTF
ncbi:MAG: DsrE family protein [candidate division WOR-3 bacterium]